MNLQELKMLIDKNDGLFWENLSGEIADCLPLAEETLPELSHEFIELLNSGTAISMLAFLLSVSEEDLLSTLSEVCGVKQDTSVNLNDLIAEINND